LQAVFANNFHIVKVIISTQEIRDVFEYKLKNPGTVAPVGSALRRVREKN
jgi:hypothetical protein